MLCKKCGQENEDNAKFCDSCGVELSNIEKNESMTNSKNISTNSTNYAISTSGIIAIIGGVISIIGSIKMIQIKSVSGNSIAESFYSSFGIFGIGFGLFMIAIGIYIYQKNN